MINAIQQIDSDERQFIGMNELIDNDNSNARRTDSYLNVCSFQALPQRVDGSVVVKQIELMIQDVEHFCGETRPRPSAVRR